MRRSKQRNDLAALGMASACALAVCLAGSSPARAYNVQRTEDGTSVRWHASTVTLRVSPELEAYFGDLPLTLLVDEAASAWGGLEGVPELLVSRGTPPEAMGFQDETAGNGVYLVKDWALWPDALAATVATFQSRTGKLVDADVQVNANYAFALLSPKQGGLDRYDLLSVLTHEMGHVLGLGDAYDAPGATMWPSVAPGDTYQRDLDADDEAGLERIYSEGAPAASLSGAGCGGASVLWPLGARAQNGDGWLSAALILLALWLWSRSGRGRTKSRYTIVLGGALLFGGLFPKAEATPPLQPVGVGQLAPTEWLPREHPIARQRLAKFVKGGYGLLKGRATSSRAERRAGLIWTHLHVQGAFGVAELETPGGSLDGLTQVVSGHPPPLRGEQLVVVLRKHGPHGWAHLRDGLLFGGTLGDGPAVRWE
jgi:hypothetical protein